MTTISRTASVSFVVLLLTLASMAQAQDLPHDLTSISPAQALVLNTGRLFRFSTWPNNPPLPPGVLLTDPAIGEDGSGSATNVFYSASLVAVFWDDRQAVAEQMLLAAAANGNHQMLEQEQQGEELGAQGPYATSDFYLEPVSVVSNLFNAILHNTTNGSTYLITSTEAIDPVTNSVWLVEGSLQGGTNEATQFALGIALRTNNLFIRAQPCDDCATTTLPLDWQLTFFGVTGVDPYADYDGDQVYNLTEYQYGTDPNKIQFRVLFDNLRVSGGAATAAVTVLGGVPSQAGVLVDSTNLALATWSSFSPTIQVALGSAQGPHDVWIGLKGLAATSAITWEGFRLTRDTIPPTVFVTSPPPGTVAQPVLQLAGYSTEPLASVRYDVANAAGIVTNLEGGLIRQWFDTNQLAFTTNWFECLDIALTNGVNTITLYATDQAGNVSSNVYIYTLDYSGVTNPPALTLYWPQDGTLVGGTNFTLRGLLDDPTATVTAQITDTNGTTVQADGLVERNGLLWVEDLPLGPGTNTLTLTMSNAAGLSNVMSLSIVQSDVILTIDDLSATDLNQPLIYVSGSVSPSGYDVWVNGVQATAFEGTWAAMDVPVNEGGTAIIQARAFLSGDSGGNRPTNPGRSGSTMTSPAAPSTPAAAELEANPDKAPVVVQIHYDKTLLDKFTESPPSEFKSTKVQSIEWDVSGPGLRFLSSCWGPPADEYHDWTSASWGGDGSGVLCGDGQRGADICGITGLGTYSVPFQAPTTWPGEFCDVSPQRDEPPGSPLASHRTRVRAAHTRFEFHTNGKSNSHRQNLFVLSAAAQGVGDFFWPEVDNEDARAYTISPTSILLGGLGRLGNDGRLYKVLPDNTIRDITPLVQGNPYYTFQPPAVQKYKLHIVANGSPLAEDRIAPLANFVIGQRINFYPHFTPSLPETPQETVKWTMAPTFINSFTAWVLDYDTCLLPSIQNVLAKDESYYDQAWGLTDFTVDAQRLQQEQTFAWWLTGSETGYQAKSVFVAMLLTFSNGQTASVAKKGLIGMHKPTVAWDAAAYQAGIVHGRKTSLTWEGVFTANALQVRVGSFADESDRIVLQATSSSLQQGHFAITQLLVRDSLSESFSEWHLDNSFPYTDYPDSYHSLTPHSPGTAYCLFSDGPSCPIGGYMLDQFKQYFMYRSDAVGSIWVTLGIANWDWRGEITYSTNSPEGWEWVSPPYCNHSQSIQPSIEMPQWTKRKLNFGAE